MNQHVFYIFILYFINLIIQSNGDSASGNTICMLCGDTDLADKIMDSPKFENLYVNSFLQLEPCEMSTNYIKCENALYCSTVYIKSAKNVRVAFKGCSDAKIDRKYNTKEGENFEMITCSERFCNSDIPNSASSIHPSIYLIISIVLNYFFINKKYLF